ncbi:hypothetical protein VNO78_28173 [Psophocarpus tetragonolobus]|uniref:Uncharacterized protein n=1 Tax=Psophocarpus tetragonolobus TaxID=3891 RepID=A0AAN9S462_PSOTE
MQEKVGRLRLLKNKVKEDKDAGCCCCCCYADIVIGNMRLVGASIWPWLPVVVYKVAPPLSIAVTVIDDEKDIILTLRLWLTEAFAAMTKLLQIAEKTRELGILI